jgi:transcriptional regulator with XRE-family HTH domain
MFVKRELASQARVLRQEEGMSMKNIAASLGVAVSSVSRWTRDIELTDAQQERLRQANPLFNGQHRGQAGRSRSARAVRAKAQADGRRLAQRADPLHIQGCMLYWAEGSKRRNQAILTNSDLDLLRVFVRFLRECYAVPDEKLALSVNCHLTNDLSLEEIERWWLARLALQPSNLRKATVNRPSSASALRRGHVLPYGTARVSVCSVQVVQSIYGAIQEYSGIDRPEWLDAAI